MTTSINIQRVDFYYVWSLVIVTEKGTKTFYLGQDEKFCQRVLGLSCAEVARSIETNKIAEGSVGNTKLANFICDALQLDEENIETIEPWELACD